MKFTDTFHCKSSLHCEACRNRTGGRTWRASLAEVFELPSNAPDFACPRGHRWGYVPPSIRWQRFKARCLPGEVVLWLLLWLGTPIPREMKRACGCGLLRVRMNRIGWLGCWRIRRALVRRFVIRARQSGIDLTSDDGAGLFESAVKLALLRIGI